jgi:dienelactone hydrolase
LLPHRRFFIPGLAGAELTLLFGTAGICAVAFTLLVSSALHWFQNIERASSKANDCFRHEAVSFQQLRGTLYRPENDSEPKAAICILPNPSKGNSSLHSIVANLLREGFIVLVIDWGSEKEIQYPEILGLLPSAVTYLTRQDNVDPERIGVLGIDLGGDLAIRSAATDPQIAAVLALAPLLSQANIRPGLSILKEMSYLEALRWASFRGRGKLVADLAALDAIAKLGSRPLLLLYGDQSGIISADRVCATLGEELAQGRLKVLPGEGHFSMLHSPATLNLVAWWFKENLQPRVAIRRA